MNSNNTEMEQVIHTHRTSSRSGWPRGFAELNPSPTPEHFLLSQWIQVSAPTYSLLIRSKNLFALHKVWQRTYPISYADTDATFSRSARKNLTPLQKSSRNHRSCVWTEALSGNVFVRAGVRVFRFSVNKSLVRLSCRPTPVVLAL